MIDRTSGRVQAGIPRCPHGAPVWACNEHKEGRVCSDCGEQMIQPDVTMQGPRGPWVHESSRTVKCPVAGRGLSPTDDDEPWTCGKCGYVEVGPKPCGQCGTTPGRTPSRAPRPGEPGWSTEIEDRTHRQWKDTYGEAGRTQPPEGCPWHADGDPDCVPPKRRVLPCGHNYNDPTQPCPTCPSTEVTYVAEGWWHPSAVRGIVHDHPENPGRSWSEAMHRLCQQVYTQRPPRHPAGWADSRHALTTPDQDGAE